LRSSSTFGPISGAHFNPAVTLADASQGGLAWREVPGYVSAQLIGAFAGVAVAHLMFGEAVFSAARHVRTGGAQIFSEFVATFGLVCVIWGCARLRSSAVPFAVGAYINRGLLVHGVNILCQSRRDARPLGKRYLCRNPARRRAGVYRGAIGRGSSGNGPVSLAGAVAAERCRVRGSFSFFRTEDNL
jgi:glycerol uptake facilitator-like aquaporin